jgi:hypothetical protein
MNLSRIVFKAIAHSLKSPNIKVFKHSNAFHLQRIVSRAVPYFCRTSTRVEPWNCCLAQLLKAAIL